MKKSPSRMIDERIEELSDWRGKMLARLHTLIKQVDGDHITVPAGAHIVTADAGHHARTDRRKTMTRQSFTRGIVGVVALHFLGAVGTAAAQPSFPPTSFLTPAKATWESTRNLVIGIVEVMPEDKWDFKPTPDVRTFRDNVIHLVAENYLFFGRVAGENLGNPAQNLKSRDELLKALRESYDYGNKVWAGLTEDKALEMIEVRGQKVQRWSAILAAIQDNMNHYGNLVIYVRLNGLVPPRSAGR